MDYFDPTIAIIFSIDAKKSEINIFNLSLENLKTKQEIPMIYSLTSIINFSLINIIQEIICDGIACFDDNLEIYYNGVFLLTQASNILF